MKIKFISLNIFLGEFIEEVVKFLQKENPDLFVLQEVCNSKSNRLEKRNLTLQILRNRFPGYNYFYSPSFFQKINGDKVNCGNAIFSKSAMKKVEEIFFYRQYAERKAETVEQIYLTPRNLQHALLNLNGMSLNIFNTQGVWGLDGKDNKYRLKMSKIIIDQIKDKENVILAGDMNVSPNTTTINNIEKYLINVFKNELTSTFNMKVKAPFIDASSFLAENDKKSYARSVVDMIFISPNIKVLDHYLPRVDVSDHYPLVAVLEI